MSDKPETRAEVELPKWREIYPIVDKDHQHLLEMMAGIHEFGNKLPRHEAEQKAHEEYVKDLLHESAAHHLGCLHMAHAGGDMATAKKHAVMYATALKKLGHEPVGEPPPEVAAKLKQRKAMTKFRPHVADAFLLPPKQEAEPQPVQKAEARHSVRRPDGTFGHSKTEKWCTCGKKLGEHSLAYPHTHKTCKGFKPDGRRND